MTSSRPNGSSDDAHAVVGERQWQFFPAMVQWAQGVLAWHAGRAGDCVATLRPAAAALLGGESRMWTTFVLADLAEAAADAGDADAAAATAHHLHGVAEFVGLPVHRGVSATATAWARLSGRRAGASRRVARDLRSACWTDPDGGLTPPALTMCWGVHCRPVTAPKR